MHKILGAQWVKKRPLSRRLRQQFCLSLLNSFLHKLKPTNLIKENCFKCLQRKIKEMILPNDNENFAWRYATITWVGPAQVVCQDQKKRSTPQNFLKIQKKNFPLYIEASLSPSSLNDNALQSLLSTLYAPKSCTYVSKYLHISIHIISNSIFPMVFWNSADSKTWLWGCCRKGLF